MTTRSRVLSVLLIAALTASAGIADSFAQTKKTDNRVVRTITGTVNAGEPFPGPLPGTAVINAKTKQGVVTDENGNYSIGITGPEDIIQFRLLGYKDADRIAGVGDRLDDDGQRLDANDELLHPKWLFQVVIGS